MKPTVHKPISLIGCVIKKIVDQIDTSKLCNGPKDQTFIKPMIIQSNIKQPYGLGTRHVQVLLLLSGYALAYSHKVNLSVGIVAMELESKELGIDTYNWNESTRGLILSSVFWGYMITPLPVGIIAHRYGAKLPLFVAILISSIATLCTPFVASCGWHYLCALRFIIGMMQGSVCPCLHTLLSKWIHPSERGFLSSVTYSGGKIGIILTLASSGFIASSKTGWPGIFYYSGGLSLLWTIIWLIYGCNSPSEYKTIAKDEREFIESSMGFDCMNTAAKIPWKEIWSSPPFLCLIFVHAAASWGYFLLLTEIPTYISSVLHFDIKSNALFSALPYLVMLIVLIVLSRLSDNLLAGKHFSVITGRKLFNTIGMWIPMICLFALGYIENNKYLAILLLTLAVGLNAGIYIGFFINHMDLSPNFAGTLVGVTAAFAHLVSVFAPIFVGYFVTDKTDGTLWNIVFQVSAGIYFVGNFLFLLYGEAKIQPWNEITNKIGSCKLV